MHTCYEQSRGAYVWLRSGTDTVVDMGGRNDYATDVLDCPVMKSGVYKWRIQVVQGKGHDLGVLATCPSERSLLRSSLLAYYRRNGGWSLFEGHAVHGRGEDDKDQIRGNLPCDFMTASIVSFSLDLDRGGILTASIDGDDPFEVFSGMCRGLGEEEGFLPDVYVYDGSVKFLGFEQDDVYF
jgi:hypothetical protein